MNMDTKRFSYTRLYTRENGDSAFANETLPLGVHPTNPLAAISAPQKLDYMKVLSFAADAIFDWHTAPCRQFIFHMQGRIEVEASNGEKRIMSPGDVIFVEDTTGKGHITRILSGPDALIAVCPVPTE